MPTPARMSWKASPGEATTPEMRRRLGAKLGSIHDVSQVSLLRGYYPDCSVSAKCRFPPTSTPTFLRPAEQRIQVNLPAITDNLLEIESQCLEHRLRHRFDLFPHVVFAVDRMLNVIQRLGAGGGHKVAHQST